MEKYLEIIEVHGREILDSRGNPTVAAVVTVKDKETGRCTKGMAAVPSGASTGQFEAVELRDGETRYFGLGVQHAVKNIDEKIAGVLLGENALEQIRIDRILTGDGRHGQQEQPGCQCHAGSVHGGGKSSCGGTGPSPVPLLRRNLSETSAGTHDEYLKRRKACGEHRGFPGVHDHARTGGEPLRKGYGSVRKFIII